MFSLWFSFHTKNWFIRNKDGKRLRRLFNYVLEGVKKLSKGRIMYIMLNMSPNPSS